MTVNESLLKSCRIDLTPFSAGTTKSEKMDQVEQLQQAAVEVHGIEPSQARPVRDVTQ